MKLHLIHEVFDAAGLPRMTKDQLMALAATPAGKQLAEAITSFSAGDHTTAAVLGLATRSVSAGTVTLAKAAGVTSPGMLATELAITKGESFFDALEAAAGNIPGKAEAALADLRSAGALPVRQDASPPYNSFKVFGRSAALCFAEACTRSGDLATINIEGAIGSGALGGSRMTGKASSLSSSQDRNCSRCWRSLSKKSRSYDSKDTAGATTNLFTLTSRMAITSSCWHKKDGLQ